TTMELIYYVVGQIVGGLIATFALLSILKGAGKSIENLGQNGVGELSVPGALTVEIILRFIFVLDVMTVTSAKKVNASLA
ncbi:aquaporin, partial [Enterococcus faecalis]|uniref:aquaporin n=1 Tax=Enterococcus faecalis TaxID=1351 RepID=UPI003D6B534E